MSERNSESWNGTITVVILAVISIHLLMITRAIRDLKPAPPVAVQPEPYRAERLSDEPPPTVLPKERNND